MEVSHSVIKSRIFKNAIYYNNKTLIFVKVFSLDMVKKLYVAMFSFFFVHKHQIYLLCLTDLVRVWHVVSSVEKYICSFR
jgi:hypothetical protein